MGFMTFLAAIGAGTSTALLGFILGGLHEVETGTQEKFSSSLGALPWGLVFVAICSSLILAEPTLITPWWLQYLLVLGLPLTGGYSLRRVVARSLDDTRS